jgi:hypothetical protein
MLDSLGCHPVVPCVSAGSLQSVHRLGSGIASLRNIPQFTIESFPGEDVHRVIEKYAERAVELAYSNREAYDHNDEAMDFRVVDIFVRNEWEAFLKRVAIRS